MSKPVYDVEQEADGWWVVTRNGYPLSGSEFISRDQAEAAVREYEAEDYEAEEQAREQDEEFDRDR